MRHYGMGGPVMLPLSRVVRNLEAQNERESMRGLMRREGAAEAMGEVMRAIQSGDMSQAAKIPAIFNEAMQQGSTESWQSSELNAEARQQLAYGYASFHWQDDGEGGWKLWDFAEILAGMVKMRCDAAGRFLVETADDQIHIEGPEAQAFERYLLFLGFFEARQLRTPCPVCLRPGNKPGMDPHSEEKRCPECAGLAWVLDDRSQPVTLVEP
jgi:hypothetical protein